MTSWHLADLESSLVPTCTNILYAGCWGPHQVPILTAPASAGRGSASGSGGEQARLGHAHRQPCPGSFPLPGLTDASPRLLRTYADLYRGVLTLSLFHVPGNVSGVSTPALATRVDIASQLWHSSPAPWHCLSQPSAHLQHSTANLSPAQPLPVCCKYNLGSNKVRVLLHELPGHFPVGCHGP